MTYYSVLETTPFATNEEITDAYNRIIQNYIGKDLTDEEIKYKGEIDKAYTILNNHHSRTVYDQQIKGNTMNEVLPVQPHTNQMYSHPENIYGNDKNNIIMGSNNGIDIKNDLMQILSRLDNIEQKIEKINDNKINFYKEKKTITNTYNKKGTKNQTIKVIINENGKISETKQLIIYDTKGNVIKTYFGDNIHKKF